MPSWTIACTLRRRSPAALKCVVVHDARVVAAPLFSLIDALQVAQFAGSIEHDPDSIAQKYGVDARAEYVTAV